MVAVANGLFAQAGLPVGREFLHTLAAQYGAGVRTVDFGSAQATETINAWVRTQTADRIRRLFDSLDPATRLVLANAVYLKADWARPFAEYPTTKEAFTRADGSTVRVPTMHLQATLRYAAGPGWQAVELPYAGGELAMWVLLPTDGAAPGPLLAPATLRTVADQLHDQRVAVALPRFDFATDLDLVTALQQLGLHTAFGPDADFSGIVPGLFISQAVHRANITVDEWGTEAAAVTGLAFAISAAPPPQVTVRADHPFAFAIVHRPTRAPVFMGVVAQPSTR
jgi:serpin B